MILSKLVGTDSKQLKVKIKPHRIYRSVMNVILFAKFINLVLLPQV